MNNSAVFSLCGKHRFSLVRAWDLALPCLYVVMLNPSKADATMNDHTVTKLIGFCTRLGFGSFVVGNLSSFCATDPKEFKKAGRPVHIEDDAYLSALAIGAASNGAGILCAWGAEARGWSRVAEVIRILQQYGAPLWALDFTDDGIPRHPLMLSYRSTLTAFNPN